MVEYVVDDPDELGGDGHYQVDLPCSYLGMMPCMVGSSMMPSMVWVLPLEVWP